MATAPTDHGYTGVSESQDPQETEGYTRGPAPQADTIQWKLPLEEFVFHALEWEDSHKEDWHSPLFHFTRLIKSWCKEGIKTDRAWKLVDGVIKRSGGWLGVTGIGADEAYAEFSTTWRKVRWRADESPLQNALSKAEAYPVGAPKKEDRDFPTPGYDRFISLAGWLQLTVGEDKPILLPCREVAEALKTTKRMVSLWRQMAITEGFLEVITPHEFRSGGGGKATELKVTPGFVKWFKDHLAKKLN